MISQKLPNWRKCLSRLAWTIPALLWLMFVPSTRAQNPPTGTQHTATLTWQAPSPVGGSGTVKGYNVYRATTGVNYAKVNASLITGLTTVDSTVVSGTTYGYCATTVDSANNESPCTIPVNSTIPSNPNLPTGLTVVAP